MWKSKLAALLFALPTFTVAAQTGVVERVGGEKIEGVIGFSEAGISVKTADGKVDQIPLAETQSATFTSEPEAAAMTEKNGLRGSYYPNIKFEGEVVERIDPTISFDWGELPAIKGVHPNGFSIRWEGEIECPVGGEITFEVESDDGNRLWVDGKAVTDHWQAQTEGFQSGTVTLEANRRYPIRLEYYDAWGPAVVRLYWKADGLPREIIPAKQLHPLALKKPDETQFFHEVRLRRGSTLAGKIIAADQRRVTLLTTSGKIIIPTPAVSFMKFAQRVSNQTIPSITTKKPGIAFLNRDYAEGEFKELKEGVATMESILFGQQKIQQAELRAIKLVDQSPLVAAQFFIITRSNTRLFAKTIESLENKRIKVKDTSGYHLTLPIGEIREIRVFHQPAPKDP